MYYICFFITQYYFIYKAILFGKCASYISSLFLSFGLSLFTYMSGALSHYQPLQVPESSCIFSALLIESAIPHKIFASFY